jgi:MoaA/NifB/PqqE/SkfB family radical SAM enzyme
MKTLIPLRQPDPPITDYPVILVPQSVHLRLTQKCNYECGFCELQSVRDGTKDAEPEMTQEVIDATFERFVPYVEGVELAGLGEPTLARLFPSTARRTVETGKVLYFPTNGTQLGKAKVLDNVGETPRVSVSLDAGDAEMYSRVRGGNWSGVLAATRTFIREKPKATMHSQYTAGAYNIDGLPQWVETCAELGIRDLLMRFVQCHTEGTAREEVSLRYHRDRTERAIEAARAVAEREGVWFMAERREYSSLQADEQARQGKSASQILMERYLDFVPFSGGGGSGGSLTCMRSGTSGSQQSCVTGDTLLHGMFGRLIKASDVIPKTKLLTRHPDIHYRGEEWVKSSVKVVSQECIKIKYAYPPLRKVSHPEHWKHNTLVCSLSHLLMVCRNNIWDTVPAGKLAVGAELLYHTSMRDVRITSIEPAGLQDVYCIELTGPSHTYFSDGVWSHNPSFSKQSHQPNIVGPFSIELDGNNPVIIRTPRKPLIPGGSVMPLASTPAAFVIAGDGAIWSCFARHETGNVLHHTLAEVVADERYQSFLQHRANNPDEEELCRHCSRVY